MGLVNSILKYTELFRIFSIAIPTFYNLIQDRDSFERNLKDDMYKIKIIHNT